MLKEKKLPQAMIEALVMNPGILAFNTLTKRRYMLTPSTAIHTREVSVKY